MPPVMGMRRSNLSTNDDREMTMKENAITTITSTTLSDYELLRQQKIMRNEEKLRSLGLFSSKEETSVRAEPKTGTQHHHKKSCSRSSISTRKEQRQPTRRISLRLRGIDPFPTGKNKASRRQSQPRFAGHVFVDVTNGTEGVILNGGSSISNSNNNKSSSKEHCQMRMRTMSIPQLQQRIRTIERAQGQHCISKLSVMYECCIDDGLHELAEHVNDAILRLTT